MGADSGQKNDSGQGLNDIIMISTEVVESFAAGMIDNFAALRSLYKPIPSSRETLTGKNTSGAMSTSLQKLYDAEVSFYKNMGRLETGAQTLRNIAITYDNAERVLLGQPERNLIEPTIPPGIDPYSPDPKKPAPAPEEKRSTGAVWKWNRKQYQEGDDYDTENFFFDKYGKLSIGQKKRINFPTKGSYKNQETFAWTAGISFLQGGKKEDMLKKYDWDQKKKVNPYEKEILKRKGDDPFAPKKVGTYLEAYVEYSCSWTGIGAQTVKVEDSYKYAAEAYVARAQAKVHAGVGAYAFEMPDGRIVQGYGLHATAGASFTLAGAAASGDLGYNWAGIMGSASVKVLDVYANASATVGWVDGKFVAVASGSVGVDFFSAQVSGGIRLLGVEVQASAAFKVGLSAKFEVGFDGGKFKCNIGACLGIGFEINLSFDFSKVLSVLKDIGAGIAKAARAVVRWFRRW